MKKKRIILKRMVAIFLLCFYFIGFGSTEIQAAINDEYGDQDVTIDVDLDEKVKKSKLLDLIGSFIYSLGNIAESITSRILGLFTTSNVFPWADRVIFNTLPLLDVNFINPDSNSLLSEENSIPVQVYEDGQPTGQTKNFSIGGVIRNVYFTGLSIALGFLGIIIAVLAIKLAISTIGSDKAKYKEAIVRWLTALVLLFGMHFVLAFIFYLNEELVKTASKILSDNVQGAGSIIQQKINESANQNKAQTVQKMFMKVLGENAVGTVLDVVLTDFVGVNYSCPYTDMTSFLSEQENVEVGYYLIMNDTYRNKYLVDINGSKNRNWLESIGHELSDAWNDFWSSENNEEKALYTFFSDVNRIRTSYLDEVEAADGDISQLISNLDENNEEDQLKILYYSVAQNVYTGGNVVSSAIIKELGEYFNHAAWYTDVAAGDWAPTSVSITAAILYTMFVFQSISFFIAYLKRFFMVVILSVLAPFVVIYDFLGKSVSL